MENINQKPNKFGSKKRGLSVMPIVFSGVLAAGAIAGAGVSMWQVARNYTESAEFHQSVSGRIKINPNGARDFNTAEKILKDCAEKLSRWLKDSGQKSYDVSYEVYKQDEPLPVDEQYYGYLNAQFEIDKIQNKHPTTEEEEKEKIDNDPYLTYFSDKGFNSNEKTLVYRWYIDKASTAEKPQYTIIPFRDLFKFPTKIDDDNAGTKVIVNEDGENGVVYELQDSTTLKDIYLNLAQAKKDSEEKTENEDIEAWKQPRVYLVNNIDGLYNEANYHIANYVGFKDTLDYRQWYQDSGYETFGKTYQEKDFKGDDREDKTSTYILGPSENHKEDEDEFQYGDIFNYIDQASPGKNEIDFTSKYVHSTIWTMSDFEKLLPNEITEKIKNDIDVDQQKANIKYLWFPTATKEAAQLYLNNEIKYGFGQGVSIADFAFDVGESTGYDAARKVIHQLKGVGDWVGKGQLQSTQISPSFSETIFGGNNVVGALALGFLIFLILLLVLLAVLYRTTGVMSWICMIFALSITALIATIASTAVTMSLILGMFIMSIAMFVGALNICGRMRRRLLSNEDTQLMIKKTFKKSLLPLVDISIIALIFGVCFTYVAPISLNALGLTMVVGAFATFICMYLLNGLLHGLFFSNRIMVNRFNFFGKPSNIANNALSQGNNNIPVGLDATKLDFAYYSSMSSKKIDATNKKAIIAATVVGALLIVAIILFSVLGYTNASMFHTNYCVAVRWGDNLFDEAWINQLSYVSYKHDAANGWWYFYSNANNLTEIVPVDLQGSTVLIQGIFGSTSQDILNLSIISMIIATICCSVYGIIRYNWIAFVPMFVGSFLLPMIMLGFATACQVKFDQLVVIVYALVVAINTIVSANIIGSINESWSRKDAYNSNEFKFIVNTALKNDWMILWNIGAAYLAMIVIFGLTAPAGASSVSGIGLLLIGFVVTMGIAPFILSFVLYQFMKIRNVVLNKIVTKNKNKIVVNYDDIDEQGIEGINQFTKSIPVAKESKKVEVKND